MQKSSAPTFGLALSGSGNRTTFYIGFLEVLNEAGIKIDYISACSGGSLVAAAYACGTLPEFKQMALALDFKGIREIMTKEKGHGGLYKLDYLEEILNKNFTKGKHFEEVKPIMVFTAVDIENGEVVDLCMGDIARAARISCTTPALFESVKWGNRVLVDGGVLSVVPSASLKKFNPDVTVSLDLTQTQFIFTGVQINAKKVYNFLKKFLLINQMMDLIQHALPEGDEDDFEKSPKLFSVWGKSIDLAMYANARYSPKDDCDLAIKPDLNNNNRIDLSKNVILKYYQMGRKVAEENLPKIKELLKEKAV
jgi:predicted acylesterase/phospholipase RssA